MDEKYIVLRVPKNLHEFDTQYQRNVAQILQEGESRTDRTGVNTVSVFGDISHKVDLRVGFPATSLKRFAFTANKVETMDWMLQGKFDLKTLKDKGVRIWDQNVKPGTEVYDDSGALIGGDLGPIYGKQWRSWEDIRIIPASEVYSPDAFKKYGARGFENVGIENSCDIVIRREIDQVADLEKAMATRSDSRRIILTGWNVAQLDEMSLPPCHTLAQWYISQTKDENGLQYLDCKMYQRSADVLLGVPFNIAQYALITEMLAHVHGLRPRFLYHTVGDAHLYQNHIDKGFVEEVLSRQVVHAAPKLRIEGTYNSILDIGVENVFLDGYDSYEAQKNVPIAK